MMSEELTPHVLKGEIVADDAWRLIYWRYYQRYEEGFPSLDDAMWAAWAMAENQNGAPDYIVRPDGSRLEGRDFEEAQERKWKEVAALAKGVEMDGGRFTFGKNRGPDRSRGEG
jgi:hypothetical protein